jgi:hypothetical protein
MANVKISQLPALTSLSGTDVLPVVSGNVTYNVTAANIAALGSGSLVNGANSFVLNADGSVVFTGDAPGNAVNRGMEWDFGADNGGVNSQVRQDNAGLSVRAWTEVGGPGGTFAASVNIVTNQDANVNTWIFNGNGDMLLAGNLVVPVDAGIRSATISPSFNSAITDITTGTANVIVTIADLAFEGPFSGTVSISGVTGTTEADGVWGYQAVEINEFQLFTDATLTTPVNGTSWTAYISGGTAAALGTYEDLSVQGGNINIGSNNQNWTFDIEGNLTLPRSSVITESGNPFGGQAIVLAPAGASDADQQLLIYPTALDGNHLHLTTGDLLNTELYLGNDDFFVKLANTGNIIVNTSGNTAAWTFGTDGNITLPSDAASINYANGAPYGGGGGGSTGDITFVNTTISAPNNDDIIIQAVDSISYPSSTILMSPSDTLTRVEQWSSQNSITFTTGDWDTGVYTNNGGGQGAVQFTDATNIINFVDSLQGVSQIYFSVNGGPQLAWDGTSAGGGNITFYTPTLPATDPTTVTSFEYFYSYGSRIEIDYDSEEFNIQANNVDLELRTTGQNRIEINSDENLSMNGNGSVSISNLSNTDGINITTDANSGSAPTWSYGVDGSLALATVNDESAKFVGTRRVIGGLNATSPYSVVLAAGGTPTLAYTSTAGTDSVRVTFAVQSGGAGFQWEQFDVVAVRSQDVPGAVNFVVSNRVKSAAGIGDTVVTAVMGAGQIEISLTLDAAQTSGGWASFDAVEFGLMVD